MNFLKKLFGQKTHEVPVEVAHMDAAAEVEAEEAMHNAAAGTKAEATVDQVIEEEHAKQ